MDIKSELRQPASSEPKELIVLPTLIIRPQSAGEEFDYLRYVLDTVPFSRQHKYTFEVPDHPEFQKLVEMSPNFEGVDWNRVKRVFTDQVYEPSFYEAGLRALENERPRIEGVFPTFLQFQKDWGFKVFPRYDLALTRYGRGGTSYEDTGRIIMMTRRDGTFKRRHPSHTPVHEMIEIGIREGIVNKFGLTHLEKERVVDKICLTKFGILLPGYEEQAIGDMKIDPFITDETLLNLPKAIAEYKTII